ncbi:MAG: hypothetical protein JW965_08055 [Bacteroidales bacterium]|nr:hypothetical protein [Bacteroidales bacterium]
MKKHFTLFLILLILTGKFTLSQQAEYDRLKAKIEAEDGEPHSDGSVSKDFEEYIHWLGVKAADRDLARDLASKFSMEGNPYWEERFLNLVELAQDSGESTLWMANYLFLRIKTKTGGIAGDNWQDAVFKADYYGKRLYQRAAELSFDSDYIRESVRCLMRFALADVERGGVALYYGREMEHGTQYDSEGNLLMPDMDFDILCLPRSAFHMVSEGEQLAPVDEGLSWVEEIREICEWFELYEYNEGTDLMNQFLLDFLCDDKHNTDKNLQWYLSLAQKYKLEKSENYILGFYGTLYGKVEVQEGEEVSDAPGAKVQVTDDTKYLKASADEKGNYVISKAPLNCNCPPLPISAEYQGDRIDSKYQGKLSEPDPESRQKKDLLIPGSGFGWIGTIELEITETYNCDVEEQTGELGHKRVIAGDHKSTVADILIGMTDFNLQATGYSTGAKLQYLSGHVTVNMREDHTTNGNAEKTQCHNDGIGRWEWVSPGNWSTLHETKAGQAYCDINLEEAVLNLLIAKKALGDKSALTDMQQQLAEMQAKLQEAVKTMDEQAMEKVKAEMHNMMQGDQGNASIPIIARIELTVVPKNYPVYTTYERKVYNVCTGEYEENESRSETLEMPLILPFGAEMEGIYTRDENGNDRIDASINETKSLYKMFGSGICPEATVTVSGSIYLERMKK